MYPEEVRTYEDWIEIWGQNKRTYFLVNFTNGKFWYLTVSANYEAESLITSCKLVYEQMKICSYKTEICSAAWLDMENSPSSDRFLSKKWCGYTIWSKGLDSPIHVQTYMGFMCAKEALDFEWVSTNKDSWRLLTGYCMSACLNRCGGKDLRVDLSKKSLSHENQVSRKDLLTLHTKEVQ